MGTDVGGDLVCRGDDGAVALDGHLRLDAVLGAVRADDKVLAARVLSLDRATDDLGHDRGDPFLPVRVAMAAVARADISGGNDADIGLGHVEPLSHPGTPAVSMAGGPDVYELVVVPPGKAVAQLERQVILEAAVRDALYDHVAGRDCLVGVATTERLSDREDRAVQLVVPLLRGRRSHRLEHVGYGGKHLVLDLDQAQRLVSDVR